MTPTPEQHSSAHEAQRKRKPPRATPPRPGNWCRDPWNRGTPRRPNVTRGLSPIMEQLLAERIRQGCTQDMLAERTGFSRSAVRQYESGKRKPPLAYVEAVAKTLGFRLRLIRIVGDV